MNTRSSKGRLSSLALCLALGGLGTGCTQLLGEQPVIVFEFDLLVRSDDGRPVPGAEIVAAGGNLTTDAEGRATLVGRGHEGDRLPHVVKCPKDYQSPAAPLLISLRHQVQSERRAVYEMTCIPVKRTVVVGVRADNGPNLPVIYLGQNVARTDASGAAHVLLSVVPGEPFRLTIDTSEAGNESLRPVNPSAEFAVGPADDLLVFEQKMSLAPKPQPKGNGRPSGARPRGPTRL
jgi:hypothetical protein